MENLKNLILCEEDLPEVKVIVSADIKDGKLTISGLELGKICEECSGDAEYKYFYDFNSVETKKLYDLLCDDGQMFSEELVTRFSGINAGKKIRDLCDEHSIKYKFYSH